MVVSCLQKYFHSFCLFVSALKIFRIQNYKCTFGFFVFSFCLLNNRIILALNYQYQYSSGCYCFYWKRTCIAFAFAFCVKNIDL